MILLEWIQSNKIKIILILLSIFIIYYVYTRFYGLFAIYNCLTTDFVWKVTNGKLSSCIGPEPTTCKNLDKNGIYGFCYDPDYYGIGIGEKISPYGYPCTDWITDKEECYPETCELANTSKKWGWCVDKNRAYRGSSCGPDKLYGIVCNKWIWNDPKKCPKGCPIVLTQTSNKSNKNLRKCPKKKSIPKCPIKKEEKCDCD